MKENASRGFFNGNKPPYGFRKVPVKDGAKTRYRLEPEPDDATSVKVVRMMFEMAMDGMGLKNIAKKLNEDGFRTPNGHKWSTTSVHKILTKEAYCGTLIWGERQCHPGYRSGNLPVRVKNAWAPIVSCELFEAVQANMATRSPKIIHPRIVPSFYLLSGSLYCECGRKMIGRSAKSHRHFYYECSRNFKEGKESCSARRLPKEKLERLIIDQVKKKVLNDEYLEKLIDIVNEEQNAGRSELNDKLNTINLEYSDVQNRLSKLYDSLETGHLSIEDLAPRIKDL